MPETAKKEMASKVAFADVVKLSKARSTDPEADGLERYVGLEHLEPGDLKIHSWGDIADGTTFTSVFRPGQVLFGKRRAYQRKVAVADFSGVCSGDIYVLEPKGHDLLPELLPFICQTDAFFDHAVGTSAGSLSPRTNWKSLATFEFVLPPLQEQQRIAGLLIALEGAIVASTNLLMSLKRARHSLLKELFDVLAHDNAVKQVMIADAGEVLMGRQRVPRYEDGPSLRPYLRVANVFDGYIDTGDVKVMQFSDEEFARYRLRAGDILLNEGQSRELVGRSAIFRDEVPEVCFQNTLIRFRPFTSILAEYAHCYFQYCLYTTSVEFLKELLHLAKDVVTTEQAVPPIEAEERGKAALTELFEEARNADTPIMVERVVGDIDEIVRIVRFDGWQNTHAGEREVKMALRKTLFKYRLHQDQELFGKAYKYIATYY